MTAASPLGDELAPSADAGRTIQISEWEHIEVPSDVILRDGRLDVYPEVVERDYVTVRPHLSGVRLQAGRYVGIIPLNDRLTVEVSPRVPVATFGRLLGISQHIPTEVAHADRPYRTEPGSLFSLVDIYTRTLVANADDIAFRGLHKEYVCCEEETSFPRGRINPGRSATRLLSQGIAHRVSAEWFERTADNGVNRTLKYALWLLAQLLRTAKGNRRALVRAVNRAYRHFDAVTLDRARSFMRDDIVSGRVVLPPLRSYYTTALNMALVIINEQMLSWDRPGSTLRLPSLVLDMSVIFEAYLRRLLELAATRDRWPVRVLDGNKMESAGGGKRLFDSGDSITATPDIVLARRKPTGARDYSLLVEVKYKPMPSRDDINQTLAYALSYRCPIVVIAQPRAVAGNYPPGPSLIGTVDEVAVYRYVFDLAADTLAGEEARFANSLSGLLS